MGLFNYDASDLKIAALDIGTNTVLSLITNIEGETLRVLRDDHAIARLGEGVDRTKRISDEAYQRLRATLTAHLRTIRSLEVRHIAAIGTSALRDAENREEILQRIKTETEVSIDILSGDDEALWTYRGALVGMTFPSRSNIAVIDIGGGSTEISFGDGANFNKGQSFNIGAVRITERCFATNPITQETADTAKLLIRSTLQHLKDLGALNELIAVAGTPTTLAAMHQALSVFDAHKVHNYVLRKQAVDQLLDILIKIDTTTILERFQAVNKARADILPAGTLILSEAMEILGVDQIRVSTHGLRYGIALREAERLTGGHITDLAE